MKIRCIQCALACLAISLLIGCGKKDLQFEKLSYNFGTKDEGVQFEIVFSFKNTGTETVNIRFVRPSCSCITLGEWDKIVEPGKTGKIPFTFDTSGAWGNISRNIEVISDVPEKSPALLLIDGKVRPPLIEVIPPNLFLSEIRKTTGPLMGGFTIKNNLDSPLKILEVIPPNIGLKTTHTLTVIEANQKYRLDFTAYPPYPGIELVKGIFVLKTNSDKRPELRLDFSYRVLPPIEVYPEKVLVDPKATEKAEYPADIFIRNNENISIDLADFSLENGEGLKAEFKEVLAGTSYKIEITLPRGYVFNPGRTARAIFRIKNDPAQKLYSIPIEAKPEFQ